MSIAIFGGSFDPLHNGHYGIVKSSLSQLKDIKKFIIVPTFISAFKSKSTLSPKKRLYILKKVFNNFQNVYINPYEANKQQTSYSIDTILFLRKKYTHKRIYFIIGEDNLEKFHLWKNYKKILSIVDIIIIPRKNKSKVIRKYNHKRLKFAKNICSTQIRKNKNYRNIPTKARWILTKEKYAR